MKTIVKESGRTVRAALESWPATGRLVAIIGAVALGVLVIATAISLVLLARG